MSELRNAETVDGEPKKTVADEKKGTKRVQNKAAKSEGKIAKTDAKFWNSKVKARKKGVKNPPLYLRIKQHGRTMWLPLETSDRAEAGRRARNLWLKVRSHGLDAAVAAVRPAKPVPSATVGAAIAAAEPLASTRKASFVASAMRLRQIAAEIAGIPHPTRRHTIDGNVVVRDARYYPKSPEFLAWRGRVDNVALSTLSAEAVRSWRTTRVNAQVEGEKPDEMRDKTPVEKRSALVSADSTIRMARSVFSRKIIAAGLASHVQLPSPLPFQGVTTGASTKRFTSQLDAATLFLQAKAAFEVSAPEVFLAFVLCLAAGLRKMECDRLTWEQVRIEQAQIAIRRTKYFEPKSEESDRVVSLDAQTVAILKRAFEADGHDPIFVLRGNPPTPQTHAAPTYRAEGRYVKTWQTLTAWLKKNGLDEEKPVHALRKLGGSFIFNTFGLEQARQFLGHSTVAVTSNSYVVTRKKIVVSLTPAASEQPKGQQGTPPPSDPVPTEAVA